MNLIERLRRNAFESDATLRWEAADALEAKDAEIERLKAVVDAAKRALDELARLGNEPHFGNSDGNLIAQAALKVIAALDTVDGDRQT